MRTFDEPCAAGRAVSGPSRLGGADWTTPCPNPAVQYCQTEDKSEEFVLCQLHVGILMNHIYFTQEPR